MGRLFFVTGTDTGVGKTLCAAGVIRAMRDRGLSVAGVKPFSSGCSGGWPGDARFLEDAAESGEPLEAVAPVRFAAPLAPLPASREEGSETDLAAARDSMDRLIEEYDAVVAEGIGGVMVPLAPCYYLLNFMAGWRPEAVVVGRPGLGTLNHTILTVNALRGASIPVKAVVLSDACAGHGDLSRESNPGILAECLDLPVFALPFLGEAGGPASLPLEPFRSIVRVLIP